MFLLFMFLSIRLLSASTCYNRFPLKDTVDTVKALVREYGTSTTDTDSDGTEWINVLIPEREEGLEVIKIRFIPLSLCPPGAFLARELLKKVL